MLIQKVHVVSKVHRPLAVPSQVRLDDVPHDLAVDPVASADWCTVEVIESPLTTREFTGAVKEFKVMRITPHKSGLREVRITGDAGQGTQDLGFRATTDVLLEIKPNEKNHNK